VRQFKTGVDQFLFPLNKIIKLNFGRLGLGFGVGSLVNAHSCNNN